MKLRKANSVVHFIDKKIKVESLTFNILDKLMDDKNLITLYYNNEVWFSQQIVIGGRGQFVQQKLKDWFAKE